MAFIKSKDTRDMVTKPDLALRIKNALSKGCYAPAIALTETLHINNYIRGSEGYPYVLLEDVPLVLHAYVKEKAVGSAAPWLGTGQEAYWLYDIDRWLKAIGIEVLGNTFCIQNPKSE